MIRGEEGEWERETRHFPLVIQATVSEVNCSELAGFPRISRIRELLLADFFLFLDQAVLQNAGIKENFLIFCFYLAS